MVSSCIYDMQTKNLECERSRDYVWIFFAGWIKRSQASNTLKHQAACNIIPACARIVYMFSSTRIAAFVLAAAQSCRLASLTSSAPPVWMIHQYTHMYI